jgi:sugar/nucleoside kinase (ribokinase family)
MLGELRHIAAVNDDQIGTQFVEFLPDDGVQPGLVQSRTETGAPTNSVFSARSLIVNVST